MSSLLLIVWQPVLYSQKVLTLRECYEKAGSINALAGEKEAYSVIYKIKGNNLLKGWLPAIDANGSFLYNSSVVDIGNVLSNLPFSGISDFIKPLPHEQYKITVDINQLIYDGGTIKSAMAMEAAELNVTRKQTETDLYKLKSQVNTYYFRLLLLEKQKELAINYLQLVEKRIASMQSAFKNGIITRSDIDVLASEELKLNQQLKEIEILKTSLMKILSDLTGLEIDAGTRLILPIQHEEMNLELSRPELDLFDMKKEQLAAGLKVTESKRMPKAFGFATIGYGNPPGNNFFKDEFAPYYILGAGIKWNIFDWNKTRNEKKIIKLQQDIIANRKSDLTETLKRLLEAKNAEIINLEALIISDSELINIRKRITASAESKYENGTITATELLNELNSERQAVINHEIHKINLVLAQIEYLNISGKEIE